MLDTQGELILILDDFNFEVVCKYFYEDRKDFGDWQSLKPTELPKKTTDKYSCTSLNGFVNITFEDGFILSRLFDYATKNFSKENLSIEEPSFYCLSSGAFSNDYLKYLFSVYVGDFWEITSANETRNLKVSNFDSDSLRTLSVMALYLIEKGPQGSEPNNCKIFNKLYNIFSNKLNDALREISILNAPNILKLLTVCAINIPVYQEA